MTELLKGKLLAENIRDKAKARIDKLDHPPGLAVILVGNDPASHLYVALKEKAARDVGIYFEKFSYPDHITDYELVGKIKELNERDDINGIIVQLPLPEQDEDTIVSAIDESKDVDGFHPKNRRKLGAGEPTLAPPVALAVMRLIEASHQPLKGKKAVVIGNSHVFAEPVMQILQEQGIATSFLPRDESALAAKARIADIIVVAVGEADFLKADMVKDGAIIIDVGTNKKEDATIGDTSKEAFQKAAFVSPVPGGVGPLTVAYLLMNVMRAAEIQESKS
ncbi:MAG: bifunctional 5,10-methylenetetrahydrofolate dehydrogenase/5,10-methenyltetrahydrofolate cyclohydrolase [Candidatus Uhrbacteria bacterium]|nr:bifunctional 5,10-methylenetetrahydrofolate dehydrogenase/5,10-methenyltetrahydrofolate cyclohydrolase [Candidatus Uhrbacteria bacterium]